MQGLGIDIVEIERIAEAIKKREKFKQRIFTKNEVSYCEEYKESWPYYAARFAAKEAIVKALGTGFRGFTWKEVEIVKDDLGKPTVKLYNRAQKLAQEKGIKNFLISISHSRDYAVAQAIAIGRD
ncbi:holo-ACP synthase [Natroniella sp. ANB-PHB2]|uniref:holo-ACP synthase n=1 Tax=Natroniella sp. ANB-PHB2 TaxID=3384444 RepID=UPI0038D4C4BC